MRFRTTLQLHGKTATGIVVPAEVVEALGAGRKPPVMVTLRGYTYRSTIASRGDRYLVGVSAEHRAAAGVAAGDEVEVGIELDTEPRETTIPDDLRAALDPDAAAFLAGLTASQQRGFADPIEQAKKPETRAARVEKAAAALRAGRKRP